MCVWFLLFVVFQHVFEGPETRLNGQPADFSPDVPGTRPQKDCRQLFSGRPRDSSPETRLERTARRLLFHRPGPGFQQLLRMLRTLRPYRNRTPASLRPSGPPPRRPRPNRLSAGLLRPLWRTGRTPETASAHARELLFYGKDKHFILKNK